MGLFAELERQWSGPLSKPPGRIRGNEAYSLDAAQFGMITELFVQNRECTETAMQLQIINKDCAQLAAMCPIHPDGSGLGHKSLSAGTSG